MHSVTIELDDKLKRKMANVAINWSEYIRRAEALFNGIHVSTG
ncbi:MAG: hypothetical protein ABSE39_02165 [Candidatus Bathyarchaeia archaeon]